MSKKIRPYKKSKTEVRAEFSEVNDLGVREYQSKIFIDEKTEAKNRKAADKWLDDIEAVWKEKGTFQNEEMTLAAFVESKKKTHFHEAIIRNGKKISGYKGYERVTKYLILELLKHFGKAKIKNITAKHCEEFRIDRLNTPTYKGTDRGIECVHREMAMLRRIFNLALTDRIITFTPKFEINPALERVRDKILTADEEKRLLAALEHRTEKQGKLHLIHLRPLVICALTTACRAGELLKLQWKDVDFDAGVIRLMATNTKTESERVVPISDAARIQLESRLTTKKSDNDSVFGLKYYSDGFRELLKAAKIYDCRFHDLRHTGTTALVRANVRTEYAMKATGHQTLKTFMRYLNPTDEDMTTEFQKVEAYRIAREMPELATEAVN